MRYHHVNISEDICLMFSLNNELRGLKLREMIACNKDLVRKLDAMERKYGAQFKVVIDAIRQTMTPPEPKRQRIGFTSKKKEKDCMYNASPSAVRYYGFSDFSPVTFAFRLA